ncbi:MAG: GNVR domain-containing protein [Tepidanaerobacteraceae bacterium]
MGDANIMVVSPAIVPESPVAPRKMLNVAIAMVLGLMLGVFVVFFMDYWKNSADPKSVKNLSQTH